MRKLVGQGYTIHIPIEGFKDFVIDKVHANGEVSYSEEFEINDITYDKENGYIYLNIDMFKRMDA